MGHGLSFLGGPCCLRRYMEIGQKIKTLRLERGMKQKELAKVLSISSQAISKCENGKTLPDISVLPQIADYFGISMDELFDYKRADRGE